MFRQAKLLLFVGSGLLIGCSQEPPTHQDPPAASDQRLHTHPFDWVNDPPPTIPVDFKAMEFKTGSVKDAILHWENIAAGLYESQWHHESWHRYRLHSAVEWWSTTPQHILPHGDISHRGKSDNVHLVRIECVSNTDVLKPEWAGLHAQWSPQSGWGAYLYYTASSTPKNHASLYFKHAGSSRLDFYFVPSVAQWEYQTAFDKVIYRFNVSLPDLIGEPSPMTPELFRQWISSEDAFREAGLKAIDRLELAVKAELAPDKVIKAGSIKVQIPGSGTRSDNPPAYRHEPVERPLSAEEQQAVFDAALKEISNRREILKTHSAAMYAALLKAFPVDKL